MRITQTRSGSIVRIVKIMGVSVDWEDGQAGTGLAGLAGGCGCAVDV